MGIVTDFVGGDFSATVKVAVCPASLVNSPLGGVTRMPAGGSGIETCRSKRGSNMLPEAPTSMMTVSLSSVVFWTLTEPVPLSLFGKQVLAWHDERRDTKAGEANGLCVELPTAVTVSVCCGSSVAE